MTSAGILAWNSSAVITKMNKDSSKIILRIAARIIRLLTIFYLVATLFLDFRNVGSILACIIVIGISSFLIEKIKI